MGYLTGVDGINRLAFKVVPTARLSKITLRERLADVNLEKKALKGLHDGVRILHGDNDIIPIDVDLSRISCDRSRTRTSAILAMKSGKSKGEKHHCLNGKAHR
jgi:hypothetical protein